MWKYAEDCFNKNEQQNSGTLADDSEVEHIWLIYTEVPGYLDFKPVKVKTRYDAYQMNVLQLLKQKRRERVNTTEMSC